MENNCLCPICREMMIIPRLYDCGHSICQECMIKSDESTRENTVSSFQLPVYRCPMCRQETHSEWSSRPINHSLIDLLSQNNEEYKKATAEYKTKIKEDNTEELDVPESLNFAYIVYKKRMQKCNKIYKKILPVLFKAAVQGKPYVTITANAPEIQNVADLLAKKLFTNNSVYKVQSSYREFQIDFVPSDRSYKCEYENPSFTLDENNDSDDSDDNESDQENYEEELPSTSFALPRLQTLTTRRQFS